MHLLEDAVEVGGEGIEDLGAQRLGDLADVMEQLRGSTLGVVLELDQTGVQRAQLLVGREGSLVGRLQLGLGVFAAEVVSAVGYVMGRRAVLPELIDLAQQLNVPAGHIEALQRAQHSFEARDSLVAGLRGGDDHQPAVDVVLLAAEGRRLCLQLGVVLVLRVLCIVEVALGVVELLLEQTMLGGDGGQQCVQRIEIACRLQLVVEKVVHAAVAVVHVAVVAVVRNEVRR